MIANTRVRGLRRVSRSSSIKTVADAGGARVEVATIDTSRHGLQLTESVLLEAATARPTPGRFQRILGEMFGTRRRARHANPPSAPGERQSLYFAHAMCTDRDVVAGVANTQLPYVLEVHGLPPPTSFWTEIEPTQT
jgi:hypothetical protein